MTKGVFIKRKIHELKMTPQQAHNLLLSPPGDTLLETLEHKGISPSAFAERLGKPLDFVMEIIQGKASITEPIAQQLEKELGISTRFWLERERHYQLELPRTKATPQKGRTGRG